MTLIVSFDDPDPGRVAMEQHLSDLPDDDLAQALAETRRAAAAARAREDMEHLFKLVRGMKTIHRIANRRGLILMRPRIADGP
jgi:hypothetical protein